MDTSIKLADQLAEFKAGSIQRSAPERIAVMEAATAQLKAGGIESQALKVGDSAPDLSLPDALGTSVSLSSLWQVGPLVVIFYRGGWCPYCNLELKAWQGRLPELKQLGATLVAISPQSPDNSLSTAQKNELAFAVLSDSSLQAAESFKIAFEMAPDLVELYKKGGNDLPTLNGNGRWVLPVPATYVIDRRGQIVYAHVEADYRERAEPEDVLAAVARARDPALS
ncbi:peroxiredoxin-like family protein [soil metagenome]